VSSFSVKLLVSIAFDSYPAHRFTEDALVLLRLRQRKTANPDRIGGFLLLIYEYDRLREIMCKVGKEFFALESVI
jgi:hypothetical protein